MRYVAFEGGGEPVTALLGNHVQAVSGDLSEMVPYLQGNKIRVLAVFSSERLPGRSPMSPPLKSRATTGLADYSRLLYGPESQRRRVPVVGR